MKPNLIQNHGYRMIIRFCDFFCNNFLRWYQGCDPFQGCEPFALKLSFSRVALLFKIGNAVFFKGSQPRLQGEDSNPGFRP